jgi:hypothetical protein
MSCGGGHLGFLIQQRKLCKELYNGYYYTPAPPEGGYSVLPLFSKGPSWSCGSWIYNYLCNQCLSWLMRVWTSFMARCTRYNIADLVDFYTHWTYMLIFLSNYWWQKSDIWSQASYRYPISWEAFFDPSDSYFLYADFVEQEVGIWWVQKASHDMGYLYETCDQISDFCHQ